MSEGLLGLAGGVLASLLLYFGTRNTNVVTRRRDDKANLIAVKNADGEAYERAVRVNKEITDAMQREMERMQSGMKDMTRDLNEVREALDKALQRARKAEAERDIAETERDVALAQLNDPRLRGNPPA